MAAILALTLAMFVEKPGKLEVSAKQDGVAKVAARLPLMVSITPEKNIVRVDENAKAASASYTITILPTLLKRRDNMQRSIAAPPGSKVR